nr:hypothetical protein [Tanacetum cinerariifolium]
MPSAYFVSTYASGPRSDQVTRFKSTKREHAKIDKGLTNGKNSPWVGKALSITPETESDEVTESNSENLLPIPSECEVALEDKRECTVPISENFLDCDNHSDILFDSNNVDLSSEDESFEVIEYVDASVPDPAIASVEEENVVQ